VREIRAGKGGAAGGTYVILASGPSLTEKDVRRVREWRTAVQAMPEEKRQVIAINSSYQIAPWADFVFAMDGIYWQKSLAAVKAACPEVRLVTTYNKPIRGVEFLPCLNSGNSGAGGIGLAAYFGASKIVLLGFDCQYAKDGKRHFFGNHPAGLNGNAGSVKSWPQQFKTLAYKLGKNCEIINCSRSTKLDIWPIKPLEDVLNVT
jgi:hypothetical protein